MKFISARLRRCNRKYLEFSAIYDSKLEEWKSDMKSTEAAVKKYQEELELRSKFPPFSWFQDSVSKMDTSELSSLKRSIVNGEKSLTLPASDALELAYEIKDKNIGGNDVKTMGEMFTKAIREREAREEILDVNDDVNLVYLDKQATSPEDEAAEIEILEALANLPDVPQELFNDASANPWFDPSSNIDEEIEKNLIRLKFFNITWLPDKLDSNAKSKPVTAGIEELSEDALDDDFGQVTTKSIEPVLSTSEERKEFNDWYSSVVSNRSHEIKREPSAFHQTPPMKISVPRNSPKQPTQPMPILMKDKMVPCSCSQVTNMSTPVWLVNMEAIIVLIIAMFNFSDLKPLNYPFVPIPAFSIPKNKAYPTPVTPVSAPAPAYSQLADVTTMRSRQRTASWDLVKRWGCESLCSEISGFLN